MCLGNMFMSTTFGIMWACEMQGFMNQATMLQKLNISGRAIFTIWLHSRYCMPCKQKPSRPPVPKVWDMNMEE